MTKRSFRRALPAAVLVGLVALFAVACGGSQPTTTSPPGPSPTETGKSGSIVFSGLVDFPMTFNALDMDYMNWVTVTADDPELGSTKYEGVRLSDILTYVGARPDAKVLVITGSDGTAAQVNLADLSSDALLTVADDNSLSTVMPGRYGCGPGFFTWPPT